jgi:hypothetical protein
LIGSQSFAVVQNDSAQLTVFHLGERRASGDHLAAQFFNYRGHGLCGSARARHAGLRLVQHRVYSVEVDDRPAVMNFLGGQQLVFDGELVPDLLGADNEVLHPRAHDQVTRGDEYAPLVDLPPLFVELFPAHDGFMRPSSPQFTPLAAVAVRAADAARLIPRRCS